MALNQDYFNDNGVLRQGILGKTDYTKVKPDLQRHYPENWGRFLDNHYDPMKHQRPFTVHMKSPDPSYKYSKGIGLSYKFNTKHVLEKPDSVPEQGHRFVRFEEFSTIKDGELMISIEHCINCSKHNTTTKHDEEKYKAFASNLQGAIKEQFPSVRVIVKPISTDLDQKVKRFKIASSHDKPTVLENQAIRIGAFEVQLFKKEGGKFIEKILHSKIQSGLWPSISQILEKVHFFLPRVPRLTIALFKDLNDDNEDECDYKDIKVTVRSCYKDTTSQLQLDRFLETTSNHKHNVQILQKNRKIIMRNGVRPQTANHMNPNLARSVTNLSYKSSLQIKSLSAYKERPNYMVSQPAFLRPSSASTQKHDHIRSIDNASGMSTVFHAIKPLALQEYGMLSNRPISAFTGRDEMRHQRPASGISRRSVATHVQSKHHIEGLPMKGRGLGFFGDDNDRIRANKDAIDTESKYRVTEQSGKADQNGKVSFMNLPLGLYTVEVQGNNQFLPSNRDVNIVNDEDKDEICVYVPLKPRIDSKIEFAISSKSATGQQQKLDPSKVSVKAIMLPDLAGVERSDLEDFEFEALFEQSKGTWIADLPNGEYIINVKAQGHVESSQYIEVRSGRRLFNITCLSTQAAELTVILQAVSVQTGQRVGNAFIQVGKSIAQQNEEGVTDKDGNFEFKVKNVCSILVLVNKAGYAQISKSIDISPSTFKKQSLILTIPMIKESQDMDGYGILTCEGAQLPLSLRAFRCNGEELKVSTIEGGSFLQICHFDTQSMIDNQIFSESFQKTSNPAIRFFVEILRPEVFQTEPMLLDSSFKNKLQEHNIELSIFYKENGYFQMRTIAPPSFLVPDRPVWDICFFSAPHVLQTNVMLASLPKDPSQYFSYYSKLAVFFKNRQGMKFQEILGKNFCLKYIGFDDEGVFRNEDTWLEPGVFQNAIANQLIGPDSQKLWTHDQKKTLQKYYVKKETEDKVLAIHDDVAQFYSQFTRGMLNLFGKVSLRRFNEYLHRLH